jgi:hypothetical protein
MIGRQIACARVGRGTVFRRQLPLGVVDVRRDRRRARFGSAELSQRPGLDLPDPLMRDIELLADFSERVLALAADVEPQPG